MSSVAGTAQTWIQKNRPLAIGGLAAIIVIGFVAFQSSSPPDPFTATSCEEAIDFGLQYAQEALDSYGDAVSADDPRVIQADAAFDSRMDSLFEHVPSIGCDPWAISGGICSRLSLLEIRTSYGYEAVSDFC